MNRIFAACAAAAFAGFAGAASAESIHLAFQPTQLQTAEGRQDAYAAMSKAAKSLCQAQSRVSFKAFLNEKACIADVMAQLVSSSHNADIAALHANAATLSPAALH